MTYKLLWHDGSIMVVGCGGTGGFVAEGLCRMAPVRRLILVDHDRVERRNIGRQNFYEGDLGRFKSQALAERLAWRFNKEVEFSTARIEELGLGWRGMLTIGCVDNPGARRRLQYTSDGRPYFYGYIREHSYQHIGGWYIDAGNGEHHGQVLIGNSFDYELNRAFSPAGGMCLKLPLPTLQQPSLLAPSPDAPRRDCAEAVAADEQSPVINQMMAGLVLTFVHKLLTGTLTWMAAYIDLESGSLSTVDATPEAVARITGHTLRQLEYRPRPERVRVRVRA